MESRFAQNSASNPGGSELENRMCLANSPQVLMTLLWFHRDWLSGLDGAKFLGQVFTQPQGDQHAQEATNPGSLMKSTEHVDLLVKLEFPHWGRALVRIGSPRSWTWWSELTVGGGCDRESSCRSPCIASLSGFRCHPCLEQRKCTALTGEVLQN